MSLRAAARLARAALVLSATALSALLLTGATTPAAAQRAATPGQFDHYVLSLSWSPTYCESAGSKADPAQCRIGRPFAFVVHGLWPQNVSGWPEDCQKPAPFVPEPVVRSMLDLMPSRRLVIHEWRKHGTCAGLDATAYFDTVRKAYAAVTIPPDYRQLDDYKMVSPDEVEAAFLAANPGLDTGMIAVTCDSRRLREVRICLNKSLGFTSCAEVDKRACRTPRVVMPPMRGG
ncbi:ribonuclease T2 [Ancylobacter sonchi]|uniref:ribonuclease T2 family protein n=1 Tax=Ancylobacter sonchi TaxID=1937790 RepID=UPI001BD6C965|nr:ribonuclease T2 [Ancylobacter sonchi]MBS7536512.1 ribonuclease T2 [Ancylobacter sonchi]